MARTDIAGLLTGMPSSRPDPMGAGINSEQQRLAFGAQRAEGLQRGMRGLMGGETMTPSEQLQMAMAQLDLSKPEDLRKLASIQQATGDLSGAAQTAARIKTMATAKAQEDRAERGLEIREEQLAMQKAATNRELDIAESEAANAGVLRQLYIDQALENGNDALAKALATNAFPLEKATPLLFGTSNAVIKAPTDDEAKAFDRVLDSSSFSEKIKDLKTGWFIKDLSEETKQAIYFKAKELMTRQKMSTEDALERAITSIKLLDQIPEGSDADKKEKRKVDKRGRPLPDKTPSPQDDDAYTDIGK
jgi:hypothetical protein